MNTPLVMNLRKIEGREASTSAGIIDSQSVKTTESGGPSGYDAGKRVKGRKRHILTDTSGFLISILVPPPIFRIVMAPTKFSKGFATASPGCAISSPMVATQVTNSGWHSPKPGISSYDIGEVWVALAGLRPITPFWALDYALGLHLSRDRTLAHVLPMPGVVTTERLLTQNASVELSLQLAHAVETTASAHLRATEPGCSRSGSWGLRRSGSTR